MLLMVGSFDILLVMLKMVPISTFVLYIRREQLRRFLYGPNYCNAYVYVCIKCQNKCVSVHLDTCILYDIRL